MIVAVASNDKRLAYQAPMDLHPTSIIVVKLYKNGKLRVQPLSNQAYPFTADSGHLDRFRYR